MDWEKAISVDGEALDLECLRQPRYMLQACEEEADARKKVDYNKNRLAAIEAEAYDRARKKIGPNGKPLTVDACKALVAQSIDVTDAQEALMEAQHEADLLKGAVKALDHKKTMLQLLVQLHGQQYFAGPARPNNIAREDAWQEAKKVKPIKRRRK